MSLMFPTTNHRASAIVPITVERRFRVLIRCNECHKEEIVCISMRDEPHDPATVEDFYESGAVSLLDPFCQHCGNEGITIRGTAYVRAPTDV